jgi:WD40 repeat protein
MKHPENDFPPVSIDQQIDHPPSSLPRGEAYLIHDLQAMYEQDNRAAISRVWTSLSSQQSRQHTLPQRKPGPESFSLLKERDVYPVQRKQEPRQENIFVRRLNLLAALLVVVLLVGALTLVFALLRVGTTTGQHLITVPVQEFVNTLVWSPNSQQVAIETDQSILIVDGQTGYVLHTLPGPSQSSAFASSGVMPLASRFPASGGPGLRGIAWSPDGNQIAASFFGDSASPSLGNSTESPAVLVWDLKTGEMSRLPVKGNNDLLGEISWSSNGEYIAADIFQTAYTTDPLSQSGVVVWKVATRQMILQKNTGSLPDVNLTLAWQPGTLNLAQIGVVRAVSSSATAILIFDGTTGKMLKQLIVPVSGVLTWSPDGKYLAYTSPADVEKGNTAQILDTSTWRVVYTYKDDQNIIDELAWSPNGHFIATGETVVQNNASIGVVRVWEALD